MKDVLFGVGNEVIQPNTALLDDNDQEVYLQANASMALLRTRYLRECAGLPPEPLIEDKPSVVLINRPYGDGRSIVGLDEIYSRLKDRLPSSIPLSIQIPNGKMSLHDQASIYAKASVLVTPHGAATANFNFLPMDTVVLDVFALNRKFEHDHGIIKSLPSPPYNLTIFPVNCSLDTEASVSATTKLDVWQNLNFRQRHKLLTEKDITILEKRVRKLVGMGIMEWMDFRSYHPLVSDVVSAVINALELWDHKVSHRRAVARSRSGK